jgi:hypothetical protein
MFSCCCYKKKTGIRVPLISEEEEYPRLSETKVPFSKADSVYEEEEVKLAFSNIEYLNRIAEAKELEKKFQGIKTSYSSSTDP